MRDAMHFEAHAALYERARPPYPAELWQRLLELGVLLDGVRVLELGAGTGQATAPLVAHGAVVTAVEPGRELARRLRAHHPEVTVIPTTAEDAALPTAAFDLAVAATSMHWLELDVVLPKLQAALVPGGRLAVWRNAYGDPAASTPFRERVAAIVARRGAVEPRGTAEDDIGVWVERLSRGGLFRPVHAEMFRWAVELDASQVGELFTTFSDWTPAEAAEAAAAARGLGGGVTEHYLTPLIVMDRVER